jgi:hypothetical protein
MCVHVEMVILEQIVSYGHVIQFHQPTVLFAVPEASALIITHVFAILHSDFMEVLALTGVALESII